MPETVPHGVCRAELNLGDQPATIRALRNCDFLIHLAGKNIRWGASTSENNRIVDSLTLLHENVMTALKHSTATKILWLSSTTGYPELNVSLRESMYFEGAPPSKYRAVGDFYRKLEKKFSTVITDRRSLITLRPSAVYGPRLSTRDSQPHLLDKLMDELKNKTCKKFQMSADPIEARDWIYVGDVVEAITRSIQRVTGNVVMNIASGKSVSMFDLHKFCLDAHGLIADVDLKSERHSDCFPIARHFDTSFSQKLIGEYATTDLKSGLKKMIKVPPSVCEH